MKPNLIQQFFDGLSDEETQLLIAQLRRKTKRGPFTPRQFIELTTEPPAPRTYGKAEIEAQGRHGAALQAREDALTAWAAAISALAAARAEAAMQPRMVDGTQPLTPAFEARLARLEDDVAAARDTYDEASNAEVKVRQHQPTRRRHTVAFPLIGRIMSGRPQ